MLGIGTVKLSLTFGKTLILFNVQYVPEIRKNLISASLLVQLGYKVILESNKVVISKREIFIEKDFVSEGLFKINMLPLSSNEKSSSSQSCVMNTESYDVWHGRLAYVNLRSIIRISNLNLIIEFKIDHSAKCEIYSQSK